MDAKISNLENFWRNVSLLQNNSILSIPNEPNDNNKKRLIINKVIIMQLEINNILKILTIPLKIYPSDPGNSLLD